MNLRSGFDFFGCLFDIIVIFMFMFLHKLVKYDIEIDVEDSICVILMSFYGFENR